jgi:hypothetical protein
VAERLRRIISSFDKMKFQISGVWVQIPPVSLFPKHKKKRLFLEVNSIVMGIFLKILNKTLNKITLYNSRSFLFGRVSFPL